MKVIYHPYAEREVIEAAQFYSSRVSALGTEFLDEIDRAVQSICSDPTRLPVIEDDIRVFPVSRFPFGIYYRVEFDEIRILIVRHHSRHPDYGKGRK